MGSSFFAKSKVPQLQAPSNMNAEARAINAGSYGGRQAGGTAAKDLSNLISVYQKHGMKPQARGAAYPPGPKKV